MAEIQISASMAPDRHSDSAMITAIWVLPQAPSQFCGPSAKAEPGTSASVEPGTSASTMPRAVSGRSVKSLGERRHLAHPESLSSLPGWHSS